MIEMDKARSAVGAFQALLDKTPPEAAHVRPGPDAWTLSEIVGHLVDSASNNHQRFARLRLGPLESFPGYEAESWVAAQGYDVCDFGLLRTLWTAYNDLLLHLAEATPESAKDNAWTTQDGPATLEFLVTDYYEHLKLHTDHYAERLAGVAEN